MYDGTCTISYRLVLSRIIYKMNNQQNLKIIFIIQYTKARYTFVYVLYIYYIEDEQPTKSQNNFYHTIYHTKARYTFVYYVCDIKMCVYRVVHTCMYMSCISPLSAPARLRVRATVSRAVTVPTGSTIS